MNKKLKLFLILLLLIGFIFLCEGIANNISINPKKRVENTIIPDGYEKIDFEKTQGEEYYFYLFADNFLYDLSFFLEEKSADMSKLEKSMSMKADRREKIVLFHLMISWKCWF